MAMSATRKQRLFRYAAACCLLPIAATAVVQHRSAAAWSAMQTTIADLSQRSHATTQRLPLAGPGTQGSAFAAYEQAFALAREAISTTTEAQRIATLPHDRDERVDGTEPLRAAWQPALASLREGARRLDTSTSPAWQPGPHSVANLLHARWLVNMAVLEARAARLAGDSMAAVAWTLDAATFGADLVMSPHLVHSMIGSAMVAIASHEAWPDHALRQIDREALQRLAAGLAQLDARLPEHLDLTGELAWSGAALRDSLAAASTPSWNAWRYGLSPRWQVADGFLTAAALVEQSTQSAAGNWPQRRAELETASARLAASHNPVSATFGYHLSSAERTLRCTLARVRQLRAAIDLHLGQELPALADPLGSGSFTVVAGNAVTTLRSAEGFGNQQIERTVQR
jgi:hypothetical protein